MEKRQTPLKTPLRTLQAFLQLNPERSTEKKNASRSTGTRLPAFFDMHLHAPLRLKKIVVVPDLVKKLADTCDENIGHGLRNFRGADDISATSKRSEEEDQEDANLKFREDLRPISNEGTIARNYCNTTGDSCSRIASTLLFGLNSWQHNFLSWDIGPEYTQPQAIADGFLIVGHDRVESKEPDNQPQTDSHQTKVPQPPQDPLSETDRQDIDRIIKYYLHHIAVWEMKSLAAGSESVMTEIGLLKGDFDWHVCGGAKTELSKGGSSATKAPIVCGSSKHYKGMETSVTGRKTGPDASEISKYWVSPNSAPATKPRLGVIVKRALNGAWPSKKGSKIKEKVRKSATAKEKAAYIVQQAWAEAVVNDATFIIFHAGNLEYIGIRHRQSQTLYISELIDVPNTEKSPAYHRIQVGLFIACYKDALTRVNMLDAWKSQTPLDEDAFPLYTRSYHWDGIDYENTNTKGRRAAVDTFAINMDLYSELDHDYISFRIRIPSGILGYETHGVLWQPDFLEQEFDVHATVSAGKGKQKEISPPLDLISPALLGSGRVYRFALQKPGEGDEPAKVHSKGLVLKFATTLEQKKDLDDEFEVYQDVIKGGVKTIPRTYGIFRCDYTTKDGTGGYLWALVMRYAGENLVLHRQNGRGDLFHELGARRALDQIYMAGFTIGRKFTAEHIVIDTALGNFLSFVSLREWKRNEPNSSTEFLGSSDPNQRARDNDKDTLQDILNNDFRRRR